MTCALCRKELVQPALGRRRKYCSRACQARAYRARRAAIPVRRAARPARLTAVGITRAAVELADRDGIDGLTMRRLAGTLGVATAALYRHFPDREALLASMAELVLDEIPPPQPADRTGWRPRLRHEAHEEWRLYRRHPWMLPLLARTRPPLGPALLDVLERNFAALDHAGLTRRTGFTIYLALSGLVQGLALLWSSERVDRLGDPRDAAETTPFGRDIAELLDPAIRPVLHRLLTDQDSGFEMNFDDLLAAAVELLLDGVAVRHLERSA
ncbi:TetR/AcrR family transcriptional regulator [Nocardia asiatica]|uniref:TetR/AcrR family transcriptional regulator n=1 Tax=Nocardia asiatica TaxID=209252 RepID=UPI0024570DFF|nr:TetR/AcrR family transcriptional regulator [Nocardia asiatica]